MEIGDPFRIQPELSLFTFSPVCWTAFPSIYALSVSTQFLHPYHLLLPLYSSYCLFSGKMEVENKSGYEEKGVRKGNDQLRSSELILRVAALVLTLAASVLLGIDKQTKKVSMQLIPTLPPLNVPVTAKWRYLSAFVYFVVTNGIACSYAALSTVLTVGNRKGNKKGLGLIIMVMDLVMVALIFSSNGATGAIGLMGYEGNKHVRWDKVCNVFGKFCHQVAVALGLSFFGGLAFFFLVVTAVSNLNNKGF